MIMLSQVTGFPSSHSTNSFSIALYLAEWLWEGKQHIGINPVVTLWTGAFIANRELVYKLTGQYWQSTLRV